MRGLLKLAICVALTATLAAESTPAAGIGRYRVTIASEMVEDPDQFVSQLPAMCRCRLEPYAEEGFHGVMIRASAAAAKMLSADPRVARVEEMASDVVVSEVIAPPSSVVADARPAPEANATPWDSGVYAYDGAGNIKSIGTAKKYVYDALGRLKSAGESTTGHRQQYTYDRHGNLLTIETYKLEPATDDVKTLTVDATTNRVTTFAQTGSSSIAAEYDAAGRLTKFPGGEIVEYDAADMVVESKVGGVHAVHLYTASDERIATIGITDADVRQGSDWTIRDLSGKVLRRFKQPSATAPWLWDEDYIYRDGQLLAAEVASQERTLHFHPDHLGTPRLITGNGGAEVSARDFHPFGEEITIPDYERMKFTGHERDAASLDYMHARYYAVQWGRFLSVDPGKDWDRRQPQSWNGYAYAANNPTRYVDNDGQYVAVAQGLRPAVSYAYANSATFRASYDRVHLDRSIMQKISLQLPRHRSNRAETTQDRGSPHLMVTNGAAARDSQGGLLLARALTTVVPPGGKATHGAVIGHELHHGTEYLQYGHPNKAPGQMPHGGGLETAGALATEQLIKRELDQSKGANSLTPQEEVNLFDVPDGCVSNAQQCPPLQPTMDPGPSTTTRPP